jgi:hypothetical protein
MRGLLIAIAVAIGTLSGVAAFQYVRSGPAVAGNSWHEIAWPFPRDGWPAGRAFRCDASSCGSEVELYVRPKIGFCNCDTGVADDYEVDRVSDLDLMSQRFAPQQAGKVIRISDMTGRVRSYHLWMVDGSRHSAVGFALSHRCDLMVAVAQGEGNAEGVRRAAVEFLGTDDMTQWMCVALSGGS